MGPSLRALRRATVGGAFLLTWTSAFLLARPFCRGPRAERWRRSYLGGACRGLLRIAGVRVRVEGEVPPGPGFLVTNHLGYLDVLVLAAQVEGVFVSRADVETWPLLGRLTRWSGTVYLDRERRADIPTVLQRMQAWLDRGALVVFFPEGTSGSGDAVMPFRSSLFDAAVRTAAPVHCATLRYDTAPGDPPARLAVNWWGDMEFAPHLWGLLGLRHVEARVCFAPDAIAGLDRKQTAARAHHAVSVRFEPMRDAQAAGA